MRCYCCNKQLSDREATRRFVESEEFVDMCDACLLTIEGEGLDVTDGYDGEDDHDNERPMSSDEL